MASQTAKTEKNLSKADIDLVKPLNPTETFSIILCGERKITAQWNITVFNLALCLFTVTHFLKWVAAAQVSF